MKYTSHNRKLSYEQEEEILQKCEQKAEEGHITTVEEVRKAPNAEIGGTTAGSYVYHVWAVWLGKENAAAKDSKSARKKIRLTQKIKTRYDELGKEVSQKR